LDVRLDARPAVSGRGALVVERHQENSSAGSSRSKRNRSTALRASLDAAAEHAVADIEQHAEADRHPLARELRDLLAVAILEHLERFARQVRDQMALAVSDVAVSW